MVPNVQDHFANQVTDRSRGGLIICGMNWGAGGGGPANVSEDAKKPVLFASESNLYPFQRTLMKWFELWGYPLKPDNPTHLDYALLQTNIFLNSTKHFQDRSAEEWREAIDHRAVAISKLQPSGIIFCSIDLMERAFAEAEKQGVESWSKLLGTPSWRELHVFDGGFSLKFMHHTGEDLPIVGIKHPAGRGTSHEAVEKAKAVMGPWLDKVVERYVAGQKR